MDMQSLKSVFKWMTLVNFGFLMWATFANIVMADFLFEMVEGMFPMSRDTYSAATFLSLTIYKMLWFTFNVVPWIALSVVYRADVAES